MFTPTVGIGASFAGNGYAQPAELTIRIPHPTVFNAFATDTTLTAEDLERGESSFNIHAMIAQNISPRLRVRLFGGPSLFRLQQDAISDITYDQAFRTVPTANEVDIIEHDVERISYGDASAWGYHVGSDVSFFFNRIVGLGGFAKYSRGTIEVFDPLSETNIDVKVGGFQTGGGLRLRF